MLVYCLGFAFVIGSACKGWAKIERAKHGVK